MGAARSLKVIGPGQKTRDEFVRLIAQVEKLEKGEFLTHWAPSERAKPAVALLLAKKKQRCVQAAIVRYLGAGGGEQYKAMRTPDHCVVVVRVDPKDPPKRGTFNL